MKFKRDKRHPLGGSPALKEASGDDLRVLLLLLEEKDRSLSEIAVAAGCSLSRVEGAVSYWREAGIITGEVAGIPDHDGVLPRTGKELSDSLEKNRLAGFIEECQKLLSHTLNQTEINTLIGLMEDYCVDEGYILALLSYCIEMKKGSIRYMEKTALSLIDSGIDTLSSLDHYIRNRRAAAATADMVKKIFGVYDRPLSTKEKRLIESWQTYGYGEEIIRLVYDITVDATGKSLISYADKVLQHWHAAGCRTLDDCLMLLEKEKKARADSLISGKRGRKAAVEPQKNHSFDAEDFFAKALSRSYGTKAPENKEDKK